MALCSLIGSRAVVVILLAVCAAQWAAVNRCALGSKDLLGGSAWLPAPHADRSEYAELTRVIERTSTAPGRYNIIGVEEPWLNSNSAAFFAAKNELATGVFSYYTSLGYAANDTSAALRRMADLRTHYFVTLAEPAQSTPPNFLNVVSAPVLRQIRQNPHFAAVPFASQKGILIFESRP